MCQKNGVIENNIIIYRQLFVIYSLHDGVFAICDALLFALVVHALSYGSIWFGILVGWNEAPHPIVGRVFN